VFVPRPGFTRLFLGPDIHFSALF